jgi:hypothetical protein
MKNRKKLIFAVLLMAGLIMNCFLFDDDSDDDYSGGSNYGSITVTPGSVSVERGKTQQFTANQSSITWTLEDATGNSSINSSGLLTVGLDETASRLTVKASKSNYTTGTAQVTVVSPSNPSNPSNPGTPGNPGTPSPDPSELKVSKPGPSGVALSWTTVSGVDQYTVQRSTNGTSFGTIGTASGTSYTDTAVSAGASYYYRIQGSGVNSNVVYVFAEDYFNMPTFAQRKLIPIASNTKHYYRFSVASGQSYPIEWQNGSNQNTGSNPGIRVSAWQNNGTSIFSGGGSDGYTNPRVFNAAASGFVTIEVSTYGVSTSYDYQIYCYGIDGAVDSGTVALPPYRVSAFRVSSPSQNSITLTWDSVSDAAKYNIYRANTQNGTPGKIGESNSTSYTDTQVPPGGSFWYTIAAVNSNSREGCRFQGAFGFAASHYTLSLYSNSQTYSINNGDKQYFRLAVTAGQSYTIEWQNGNNQNTGSNPGIRVSAWQNNGTSIFSGGGSDGYSNPRVFTANATGFVTVEVSTYGVSTSYNYQIYYY